MATPPVRTEISDTYPLPTNATARAGFGKLYDYVVGLLGTTGNAAEARAALGVQPTASPAFTGTPTTATSPAQFDATTKLATMAAVQTALGSFSSYASIGASRSLTAADIGKVLFASTSGATLTLPTPTSLGVPLGGAVTVFTTTGTLSIAVGVSSTITYNATGLTALSIKSGQVVTFVASSTTTWQVIHSTAELERNADFGSSLGASGYQKLPGGLIMQWGNVTLSTTPTSYNFPIAFPTTCYAVTGQIRNSPQSVGFDTLSTTQFSAICSSGTPGCYWVAFGK